MHGLLDKAVRSGVLSRGEPAKNRLKMKVFSVVTIKDIAEKVEVSFATVSRALNNRPEVKEETRQKVLEAAKEMGYRPNKIARSLVTKRSQCLGLIVPDIMNPFFAELAQGVDEAATAKGYNVYLCSTNWSEKKELTYLNLLDGRQTDGIILASARDEGTNVEKFIERKLPLVVVNSLFREFGCHQVMIDNVRGGYLAAEHLIGLGHERIGFMGGLQHVKATIDRLAGLRAALKDEGLALDESFISFGAYSWESGYRRTKKLLKEKKGELPTAIFAGNDIVALGVMQAADERGLKVPEQLALVGFDDIAFSAYPKVQLTTVSQQKKYLGECAVKIILDQLDQDPDSPDKERLVLQPSLVIRKTCGANL